MNLEVLKKSRRAPVVGDIFVMRPPDGRFLFGRVIDTAAEIGGFPGIMLYVYRTRASQRLPVPPLDCGDLLVPPLATNRLPWSRGYFETVENRPWSQFDRLPQHCFKDELYGSYYDERSRRLPGPVEPVGEWALKSYRTIDDAISEALGIPVSPEDE